MALALPPARRWPRVCRLSPAMFPALADVVRGAGVLFPVGDHATLACEIQKLLDSPELRLRWAKPAENARSPSALIEPLTATWHCTNQYFGRNVSPRESAMSNLDPAVVEGFGQEWSRFDQSAVHQDELRALFEAYFSVFPWETLPANAIGFDLGCGSGRWAQFVAPRVGRLHCVDASSSALEVARRNLKSYPNCEFHCASVDAIPLPDSSADFGYSLGVLHHVPDTQKGITRMRAQAQAGRAVPLVPVLCLR